MGAMQELVALDLRNNQIKDVAGLVEDLNGNRDLQSVYLEGNPCCPNNNPESRLRVLAAWLAFHEPIVFPLRLLNGKPVCATTPSTLHYTTLHYTTLHYTTLHYATLYYTTHHPFLLSDHSERVV